MVNKIFAIFADSSNTIFNGKKEYSQYIDTYFFNFSYIRSMAEHWKIAFVGDCCLSIVYVCWRRHPISKYCFLTFLIGLISISIKISTLLVFPILLDLLTRQDLNFKKLFTKNIKKYLFCYVPFALLSIISLLSIFYYRYAITGNFLFPLFSSFLSPGNQQFYDWELMLKNFDREGFFHFWLFVPKNPSKIASVLGPATGFFFLIKLYKFFTNIFIKNKLYINVGLVQLLILFIFSQGRADYYASPLILLILSENFTKEYLPKVRNYQSKFNLNACLNFLLIIQICIFTIGITYMSFLNFYSLFNYEGAMIRTAYGYKNAIVTENNASSPVLNLIESPARLFYNQEFVPNHNFWKML